VGLVEMIMKTWPLWPRVIIWTIGGTAVVGFATLIVIRGRVKISLRNRAGRETALVDSAAIKKWKKDV
jgi:hypothetical protein